MPSAGCTVASFHSLRFEIKFLHDIVQKDHNFRSHSLLARYTCGRTVTRVEIVRWLSPTSTTKWDTICTKCVGGKNGISAMKRRLTASYHLNFISSAWEQQCCDRAVLAASRQYPCSRHILYTSSFTRRSVSHRGRKGRRRHWDAALLLTNVVRMNSYTYYFFLYLRGLTLRRRRGFAGPAI